MANIYGLYNCDQWRSHGSMSIIGVTKSLNKMKKAIIKELRNNNIEFTNNDEISDDVELCLKLKTIKTFEELLSTYQSFLNYVYIEVLDLL